MIRLRIAMTAAAVVTIAAALLGIGVRATDGGHAAVDEPQYLLTAISLWEDRNLDISDELADRRYRDFFDAELPVQTRVLADGRQLSPHDPLLPLILAAPVGLLGWVGAKIALSFLAGALAALLVWVAVRRFEVPVTVAGIGTALAGASAPLAVYGQQVYPEIPAALALLVGVALITGPLRRHALIALVVALNALPWLGAKYLPVAAALAVVALVRLVREQRRAAVWLAASLALSGVVYLVAHRLLWGGWTVYATGDHFVQTGEFSVIGVEPDYVGRSLRLVALLSDRGVRAGRLAAGVAAGRAGGGRIGRIAGPGYAGLRPRGCTRPVACGLDRGDLVGTDHARVLVARSPGRRGAADCSAGGAVVGGPDRAVAAAGCRCFGVDRRGALRGPAGRWLGRPCHLGRVVRRCPGPALPDSPAAVSGLPRTGARFLAAPPCLDRHRPGFAVARRALGASPVRTRR